MQPLHKRSTLHTRARAPAYTRRHALARIREPDGSRHPGKHRNPLELETEIELKIEVALTCAHAPMLPRFSLLLAPTDCLCEPFHGNLPPISTLLFYRKRIHFSLFFFFFGLVSLLARLNNFLIGHVFGLIS